MFGGTYGVFTTDPPEDTMTLFADGQVGAVDWVEWQTPQPVTIRSFNLFFIADGDYSRSFTRFSLFCWDTATAQWDNVYTIDPSIPYASTFLPPNTFSFSNTSFFGLSADITPTLSERFRAEFVAYNDEGPRIAELDGFSTPSPYVAPEPSTIGLLCAGVVGFVAYGWRKRRSARLSSGVI